MTDSGRVTIVGGGLAGSEAALTCAAHGVAVTLYEMRPLSMTPAHRTGDLAELVCSNSLRSEELTRATGLLKAEARLLGSRLLQIAERVRIPAGVGLVVDRVAFSRAVTEAVENNPLITVVREECASLPSERPLIVATGPLTSRPFAEALRNFLGVDSFLHFFDAVAPLVYASSIDRRIAFEQNRYGKGEGHYLNCPLTEDEYDRFYEALVSAEKHPLEIQGEERYFEACLPIEEIARRGKEALLFGPLKPVGLVDPQTGRRPYAVVQLRQDDVAGELYNMVGFQTNLRYGEQERVFRLIPGLEKAEFARYGKMHLNTYIESPRVLDPDLSLRRDNAVFVCGQLTGAEGYAEAIATGVLAGINAARRLLGEKPLVLPETTALGSLVRYLTHEAHTRFEPMHASFGLLPPLGRRMRKRERYAAYAERALRDLERYLADSVKDGKELV